MADLIDYLRLWKADRMAFRRQVLRLPDGRSYGDSLEDWQREDLEALDRRDKYPFASLWRPRGHSKTSDLAAEVVCELFLGPPGGRLYAAAVDRDQASLLHELAAGYIQRSPLLRESAEVKRWEIVIPATGSQLIVLSSDAPSSFGLLPTWICCDEIAEWPDRRLFDALFSATGKRPGCRFITISTAGVHGHWSEELYRLAQEEAGWYFSSRGQCASWVSAEWLKQQARLLPPETYRRLHHNEWVASSGSVLTEEEVSRVFDPNLRRQIEGVPGVSYVVGLDLGLVHDRTVLTVLHRDRDGVTVDLIRTWEGSGSERVLLADVEEALLAVHKAFNRPRMIFDAWEAAGLAQRLKAAGLDVVDVRFTSSFRQKLDANLLQLIRDGLLRCYPHEALREELRRLQAVQTRTGWRLDHLPGQHDDHVVSLGLAALEAVEQASRPAHVLQTGRLDFGHWTDAADMAERRRWVEELRARPLQDARTVFVPGDER